MKKLKKYINKHNYYIYLIISAIIVVVGAYILQDVAPFGKNSLLTIDFFHQYGPMLGELYDRVKEGSNLIYSFTMGMGLPFFRNFFNYLSSPFNIIMFLFNKENLLISFSVIIGLKAVGSAVTMGVYLKNKFNDKNLVFIPLCLSYAFCAYFIAYYWNIMWLDGMVFLPLIMLGLEKIVDDDKYLLYIFSLAFMMVANYFIAYMICLFSIFYFIVLMLIKFKKFNFKKISRKVLIFGCSSIIAGMLCAFFLIPMYFGLTEISATSDVFPTSQYYDFTLNEFIFNHFSGVESTVLNSGITTAPNISIGVIAIPLLILFILNNKISLRVKYCYTGLLLLLGISFYNGPLDFIWHAFHVPNDLPYRYSFLYSFVMVIICAYSITNIKHISLKKVNIAYVISLLFTSLLYFLKIQSINNEMIILNFIILTVFYLCYIIYHYFRKQRKYIAPIAIVCIILQSIIYINNNWDISQNMESFYSDYDKMKEVISFVENNNSEMNRIERINTLTFNDPSWYGYYGQTTFSSMEYENLAVLNNYLGLPGNGINSFYYKQTTPIYDMMFNIKYFIGENADQTNYYLYYNYEDIDVYKNINNIGLMFGVNSDIKHWVYNSGDPFTNLNDFVHKSTGNNYLFNQFSNYEKEIIYDQNNKIIVKYTIPENVTDRLYLYYDNSNIDFIVYGNKLYYTGNDYNYVSSSDESIPVNEYIDYGEKYIINSDDDSKVFYVGYNNYYSDSFYLYSMNQSILDNTFNILLKNKVYINKFEEKKINAYIDSKSNQTIYTSIPYDKGWNVYVDGKKVDTFSIGNALLGFDITEGNHNITLKYGIPYIKLGGLLFLLSSVILIYPCILKRVKN